jgi:hypothetical protein
VSRRLVGIAIAGTALFAGCAETREERASNPSGDLIAVSVFKMRGGQAEGFFREVFLEGRDGRRTPVVQVDDKTRVTSVGWINDTTLELCIFGPDPWPPAVASPTGGRIKVVSSGCRKRAS